MSAGDRNLRDLLRRPAISSPRGPGDDPPAGAADTGESRRLVRAHLERLPAMAAATHLGPRVRAEQADASRMWWRVSAARVDQIRRISASGGIVPRICTVSKAVITGYHITGIDDLAPTPARRAGWRSPSPTTDHG